MKPYLWTPRTSLIDNTAAYVRFTVTTFDEVLYMEASDGKLHIGNCALVYSHIGHRSKKHQHWRGHSISQLYTLLYRLIFLERVGLGWHITTTIKVNGKRNFLWGDRYTPFAHRYNIPAFSVSYLGLCVINNKAQMWWGYKNYYPAGP